MPEVFPELRFSESSVEHRKSWRSHLLWSGTLQEAIKGEAHPRDYGYHPVPSPVGTAPGQSQEPPTCPQGKSPKM